MIDTNDSHGLGKQWRMHPVARDSGASQTRDIPAALEQLRAEAHPATHGHRQVTLFQQAPVTLVLIAFDAGGELPNHGAQGMVTIQVLDGVLTVHADGADHILAPGQILVLTPAVAHRVRAEHASAMLLTVHQVAPAVAA